MIICNGEAQRAKNKIEKPKYKKEKKKYDKSMLEWFTVCLCFNNLSGNIDATQFQAIF